ncbi:hypothetical protein H0A36_03600 [Endozoicomonas sp. SM1973]|uniref:Uncharacterized protein n=1 Tax=Spartinivicinus marinus TaxID=2994442 RepID=A0A853HTI7_9GAMM|nr:hypothetical protein [Spartinivicinus marinus]MCX4029506.1 hypothetical protein [Spartinivicinus marinus]NYZ65080.1 hypothetical protein [Spartinivicinus marinus]
MINKLIKHLFCIIFLLAGSTGFSAVENPVGVSNIHTASKLITNVVLFNDKTSKVTSECKIKLHYIHDQSVHTSLEHSLTESAGGDCHCCFGNCSSLANSSCNHLLLTPFTIHYPAIKLAELKLFIDPHFRPPIV